MDDRVYTGEEIEFLQDLVTAQDMLAEGIQRALSSENPSRAKIWELAEGIKTINSADGDFFRDNREELYQLLRIAGYKDAEIRENIEFLNDPDLSSVRPWQWKSYLMT